VEECTFERFSCNYEFLFSWRRRSWRRSPTVAILSNSSQQQQLRLLSFTSYVGCSLLKEVWTSEKDIPGLFNQKKVGLFPRACNVPNTFRSVVVVVVVVVVVLCCVVLCCVVLCCVVLCCVVLCCVVLCCVVLCCVVLCCAVLCCAVLCCAVLCCVVLCCVVLCCVVLCCCFVV
jgi:hypothetical protein